MKNQSNWKLEKLQAKEESQFFSISPFCFTYLRNTHRQHLLHPCHVRNLYLYDNEYWMTVTCVLSKLTQLLSNYSARIRSIWAADEENKKKPDPINGKSWNALRMYFRSRHTSKVEDNFPNFLNRSIGKHYVKLLSMLDGWESLSNPSGPSYDWRNRRTRSRQANQTTTRGKG